MRIVGLDQLLNRRRLGEEIADGDAPCSDCVRAMPTATRPVITGSAPVTTIM